jgi:hypothetical protein
MRLWLIVLLSCGPALAQAREPPQVTREVVLDPDRGERLVDVYGGIGTTTMIVLPDDFESKNVVCGACIDAETLGAAGPGSAQNWALKKQPDERVLNVRPVQMPTAGNPLGAFTTNITVGLAGGYPINIRLRLADLSVSGIQVDTIVQVRLPGSVTMSGQLQRLREALQTAHDKDVQAAGLDLLLRRLSGDIRCRRVAWQRPHRTDRAVVRVEQLCSAISRRKEEPMTYWVGFSVENRAAAELHLDSAMLIPASDAQLVPDDAPWRLEHDSVAFGAIVRGVALRTIEPGQLPPDRWTLSVVPASSERRPVDVENLVFE